MNENPFNVRLPKWPAISVAGKSVTPEQAAEIIIRCQDFHFFSNDKKWEDQLNATIGLFGTERNEYWQELENVKTKYQVLELEYLVTDRISSCYVGGPNGWINWDGEVFVNDKNIGKWPDTTTVYDEWYKIAQAFPFLELTCILHDKEHCEDNPIPLVQYDIKDGKVEISEPKKFLTINSSINFRGFTYMGEGERGCTIDKFKWALEVTEQSLKSK